MVNWNLYLTHTCRLSIISLCLVTLWWDRICCCTTFGHTSHVRVQCSSLLSSYCIRAYIWTPQRSFFVLEKHGRTQGYSSDIQGILMLHNICINWNDHPETIWQYDSTDICWNRISWDVIPTWNWMFQQGIIHLDTWVKIWSTQRLSLISTVIYSDISRYPSPRN